MTRLRRIELESLSPGPRRTLLRRGAVPDKAIRDGAAAICDDVAERGDVAVREYAERFGGGFRRVGSSEISAAAQATGSDIIEALESAATNVRAYHTAQLPRDLQVETVEGVEITRRWTPLRRVGAYVPGGKASYPSSVLMTAVPAKVAGVEQVVITTPAAPDGSVDPATLAACQWPGQTRCGWSAVPRRSPPLHTARETLEPVEKIVGPGNAWVTAAKLAVFGACAIDMPAGPSEVLVFADETADATLVAVDLLCQAEHGPDSPAVLVTTDPGLPDRVEAELDRLLPELERSEILELALAEHGWSVVVPDHESGIDFVNDYAGEHVTIMTADPDADAKQITAAGSVYVGRWSPESAGDYATGANHVLPTGGLAAACGPLSVEDFGSWRQEQRITRDGLERLVDTIATLATAEGLTAHRLAAQMRLEEEQR